MQLAIVINMDNAAFEGVACLETARILREYAAKVEADAELDVSLFDSNGNKVGYASTSE